MSLKTDDRANQILHMLLRHGSASIEDLIQELVLGPEIVIQQSEVDARVVGDLPQRHARRSPVGNERPRRIQDGVGDVLAAAGSRLGHRGDARSPAGRLTGWSTGPTVLLVI